MTHSYSAARLRNKERHAGRPRSDVAGNEATTTVSSSLRIDSVRGSGRADPPSGSAQPRILTGLTALRHVTRYIEKFTFLLAGRTGRGRRRTCISFKGVAAIGTFPTHLFRHLFLLARLRAQHESGLDFLDSDEEPQSIKHILYIPR